MKQRSSNGSSRASHDGFRLLDRWTHESRRLVLALSLTLAALCSWPALAQPNLMRGFGEVLPPIDGRRIALVIGNSDYAAPGWSDLPNARNDAAHIAERLRATGFEVEAVTNADRATMIDRLRAFAARATAADIALIYYSGHGFEHNLTNYIVPSDGPDRVVDTMVEDRFVNMGEVVRAATARGLSMLFLDACRSRGPVLNLAGAPAGGDRASLFGAVNAPQSTVFYATAPGLVAYDNAQGSRLSPFATAVGMGIVSPGLDLPTMFSRIQDFVVRATQSHDPTQRPQLAGSWSRPFFFTPPAQVSQSDTPSQPPTGRLQIPLQTLSTIDESTIITRILAEHSPASLVRMAEGGDPLALYLVGYMFEWGVGVERNLPQARMWLERAAATGHPAGLLEYGYYLLNHGDGTADRSAALSLYRQAAAANYAKAMSHLGAGLIGNTFGFSDRAEGLRLLRAAAALGDANAHYLLVTQNERASLAALQALAAAGNVEGDRWLCELEAGSAADQLGRCRRAAEAGYISAQARYALMLDRGEATPGDAGQARSWAYLAMSRSELDRSLRSRLTAMLQRQLDEGAR